MKRLRTALLLALLAGATASQAQAPVQVMVLGTYHFGNPGQDIHNARVDDVLAPRRQAEVQAVVQALAVFAPQRIVVERDDASPVESGLPSYREYLAGQRQQLRNEVEQIGFRLARELGLKAVQGIDVAGEFPFAPVQAYAQQQGRGDELKASLDSIGARVGAFEVAQRTATIGQLLRRINQPAAIAEDHAWYMQALRWGQGTEQPGVRLVAAWHARNLAICARLVQQAKPGERVLVVYGAGHAHLLRRCVAEMPGWQLVEPLAYLPA
jgi:Family of unknown function (DUF5694)